MTKKPSQPQQAEHTDTPLPEVAESGLTQPDSLTAAVERWLAHRNPQTTANRTVVELQALGITTAAQLRTAHPATVRKAVLAALDLDAHTLIAAAVGKED